jgi:hypothetical protein
MKRAFFVILFSVLSFVVLSQNYKYYANINYRIYEIESVLIEQEKDYHTANQEFKKLFSQCDYRFLNGYKIALNNLFCNLHSTWDTDSIDIDFYIKKVSLSYPKEDVLFWCLSCADSKTKNVIKKQIKKYDALRKTQENKDLINKVVSMCRKDQRVRNVKGYSRSAQIAIEIIDSLNLIELDKMFTQRNSIPGIRELGIKGWIDLSTMLHHFSYKWLLKWNNYILKGINNGDFAPETIADILDYTRRGNKAKVVEGKLHLPYSIYGENVMSGIGFPVKDIEEANRKRKNIGLPPLEYSLQKMGYRYSEKDFIQTTGIGLFDEPE